MWRVLALGYCIAWLGIAIASTNAVSSGDGEAMVGSGLLGLILSAPLSFAVPGAVEPMLRAAGFEPPYCGLKCDFWVFQLASFSVGWLQWFVLCPLAWNRLRNEGRASRSPSS